MSENGPGDIPGTEERSGEATQTNVISVIEAAVSRGGVYGCDQLSSTMGNYILKETILS